MLLFYKAVLERIVRYGIMVWFGKTIVQLKSKLVHMVLTALKSVGQEEHLSLQDLYEESILNQVQKIFGDQTHFLNPQYELLTSGN